MSGDLGYLERALVDLARVALSGDLDGVRQLGSRLARRPPEDAAHPSALKEALFATIAAAPSGQASPLRSAVADTAPESSWVTHPRDVSAPVLASSVKQSVALIIAEHSSPERLEEFGLTPSRAVLFTGPPGTGKTLTARFIAAQLELPLITLDLASVMSSLMGQTGKNLQAVLTRAASEPCVLFFDEFDALAKSRVDDSDVGEVKRLVNVVLQQLDQWPSGGLLIAATNHPQLLDPAVHRRFETTVEFTLPGFDERIQFLSHGGMDALRQSDGAVWEMVALISEGWSLADLESWVTRTARAAVVAQADGPVDIAEAVLRSAQQRAREWTASSPHKRAQLAHLATDRLRWPHRKIGEWLGVSHVTIGKDLKRSGGEGDGR